MLRAFFRGKTRIVVGSWFVVCSVACGSEFSAGEPTDSGVAGSSGSAGTGGASAAGAGGASAGSAGDSSTGGAAGSSGAGNAGASGAGGGGGSGGSAGNIETEAGAAGSAANHDAGAGGRAANDAGPDSSTHLDAGPTDAQADATDARANATDARANATDARSDATDAVDASGLACTDTCAPGFTCMFEIAKGCNATGVCKKSPDLSGPICQAISLGCTCHGTQVNLICNGFPSGYFREPIASVSSCVAQL